MWIETAHIIEIRYDNGFRYWDRTGVIGAEACREFPDLQLASANADKAVFQNPQRGVVFDYGFENARVRANSTSQKGGTCIGTYAGPLIRCAIREIGIRHLARVGNLSVFAMRFEDRDKALQSLRILAGDFGMNLEGGILKSSEDERLRAKELSVFRVNFRDEKTGIGIYAHVEEDEVTIAGPHSDELRRYMPESGFVLKLDIDVHTTAAIPSEDLLVEELLKSNEKMILTRILRRLTVK